MSLRILCISIVCILAFSAAVGSSTLSDLSNDLAAIARQAGPCAVQIDVERNSFGFPYFEGSDLPGMGSVSKMPKTLVRSVGSGFVIDAGGYVLTTCDVISDAESIKVRFADGTTAPGKLLGSDSLFNVAVIKVEKTGLRALPLGDSDSLQPGMLVVSVNSQSGMDNSVSLGVVAATNRDAGLAAGPVLQISGTIGPGASGGAVLDTEGRAVGVTCAMFSPTSSAVPFNMPKVIVVPKQGAKSGDSTMFWAEPGNTPNMDDYSGLLDMFKGLGANGAADGNLADKARQIASLMESSAVDVSRTSGSSGFAIPINKIKPILEQLKSGRTVERAMLGIGISEMPDGSGILLQPSDGSPAFKAGVRTGDILVSADGRKFERAVDFAAYVTALKPGAKVNLVVRRDGKEISIVVTAGSRADMAAFVKRATSGVVVRTPAQERRFVLDLEDAGIAQVAAALSQASGKSVVVLNPQSIKGKVTVHLKSGTLESALSEICDTLGCKYVKNGDGYIIKPLK